MVDIIMEEFYTNEIRESEFKVLEKFINTICNEKCQGHLVPDEVEDDKMDELDCSKCPFKAVYDALNPM